MHDDTSVRAATERGAPKQGIVRALAAAHSAAARTFRSGETAAASATTRSAGDLTTRGVAAKERREWRADAEPRASAREHRRPKRPRSRRRRRPPEPARRGDARRARAPRRRACARARRARFAGADSRSQARGSWGSGNSLGKRARRCSPRPPSPAAHSRSTSDAPNTIRRTSDSTTRARVTSPSVRTRRRERARARGNRAGASAWPDDGSAAAAARRVRFV